LVRRIVTGHTSNGDAVIESDVQLKPLNPFNPTETATAEQIGFVNLWRTTSYPAELQDAWTEAHGADTQIPLADSVGTIARIVDFPLGPGVMHRTLSIDFGILLEGEVELDLGEGVKTLLKKHDVVVQRGTVHAWHNVGLVAAAGWSVGGTRGVGSL
jgi:hypothetical protein